MGAVGGVARGSVLTVVVMVLLALGASPASAATFSVDNTFDAVDSNAGDGVCAAELPVPKKCTLRAAIMETNALAGADTINIPAGTYTLLLAGRDENASATGDLDVTDALTITGAGGNPNGDPTATILQAGDTADTGIDKVLSINATWDKSFAASIRALTIQHGNNTSDAFGDGYGGGLDWDGGSDAPAPSQHKGTLELHNVVVKDNRTTGGVGGGIALAGGQAGTGVTITDSRITGNVVATTSATDDGRGGGIAILATPTQISNTTITNNAAQSTTPDRGTGGGLYSTGATTLNTVTVSGNSAGREGGGIASISGLTVGAGSRVVDNDVVGAGGDGGGLWLRNGATLAGVTVAGNSAANAGGGIYVGTGGVTANRSRIAANTAPSGSAVYKDDSGGTLDLTRNWWGCNAGPVGGACGAIRPGGGALTTSPLLTLAASASPTSVRIGGTSTVRAELVEASPLGGGAVTPPDLTGLDGTALTLTPSLGTLAPVTVALSGGAAQTTFTGTTAGAGKVDVALDGETIAVPVTVTSSADFGVTETVAPSPVVAGSNGGVNNAVFTIAVTNNGPDAGSPSVAYDLALPPGASRGPVATTQGGFAASATHVTWTVGPLAPGATATMTVGVNVPASVAHLSMVSSTAGVSSASESDPNSGNDAASASVLVRRPAAASASPGSLDFGPVRRGSTSSALPITITNTGGDPLTITAISPAGADPTDFAVEGTAACLGAGLPQGGSCTFTVRFAPIARGPRTASVQIVSNDTASPLRVTLSGSGTEPAVSVPSSLAFGKQRIETSSSKDLTFTNTGDAPLQVSDVRLAGESVGEFTMANPCVAGPTTTILPGASCTLRVTLTPGTPGAKRASVTIISDAPGSPHVVDLSGEGVVPAAQLDPPNHAFGDRRVGSTVTRTFTLTSSGSGALRVGDVVVSGTDFALGDDACSGRSFEPGQTCTVGVSFAPSATGEHSGTLTIPTDAPGGPVVASLMGKGVASRAALAPAAQAFGDQRVGTTSDVQTFSVQNAGDAPLNVSSVDLAGDDAGEFAVERQTCTDGAIQPGADCVVDVRFAPGSRGPATARLVVESDALGDPVEAELSGNGVQSGVSLSGAAEDFGERRVGEQSVVHDVVVTSSGDAPLHVDDVAIGGAERADFELVDETCTTGAVAPGGTCAVSVRFTPGSTGLKNATLTITSDAPTSADEVALSGTGAQSEVAAPASLSFADQRAAIPSAAQTVTIWNTGTATLNVTAVELAGADAGQFEVTDETCTAGPVAPNQSCTLSVTFTPASAGDKQARLEMTSDAPGSPHAIQLRGTGIAPAVRMTPGADFGDQRTGTESATRSVTLTNSGTDVLEVSAISLGGDDAGQFAIANETCTGSAIAAGEGCEIELRFAPTSPGPKSAALVVASDAPSAPDSVALSGRGIEPAATVAPAALAFGDQAVDVASAARRVTVTNSGTANLAIGEVALDGTDAAEFGVEGDTCTAQTLAPDASCAVSIRFAPTGLGARAASLRIASDAPSSPERIALTGRGTDVTAPAAPVILSGPTGGTTARTATFAFGGEPGGSFECRLDGAPFAPCTSPIAYSGLATGAHRFGVRQIDAAGNTSPERTVAWTVTTAPHGDDDREKPARRARVLLARFGALDRGGLAVGCTIDAGALERCAFTVIARVDGRDVRVGSASVRPGAGSPRRAAAVVRLNARGRALLAHRPLTGLWVRVTVRASVRGKRRALLASARTRLMAPRVLVVPDRGQFAGNSMRLDRPARAYLRGIAERVTDAKRIRCEGHTSTIGASGPAARAYRERLALSRARAVCRALRAAGVKARLSSISYGAERPRATNRTAAGRALNRRVELRIWR